jgi:hypothetical protein
MNGLHRKKDTDVKANGNVDRLSFHGPFHLVTACLEKTSNRKNHWCLLFITVSSLIIMPIPETILQADSVNGRTAPAHGPAKPAKGPWPSRDCDAGIPEHLDTLVRQYLEKDPDEVITVEPGTDVIPLDAVEDVTLTWVRGSGRYSRLLFFFSMYPAEPASAGYRVNYDVTLTAGTRKIVVTTPFSPELRQALRHLLGERVREIPDEYAPLL